MLLDSLNTSCFPFPGSSPVSGNLDWRFYSVLILIIMSDCWSTLLMTYSTSFQISICWWCNPFNGGPQKPETSLFLQCVLQTHQDVCRLCAPALSQSSQQRDFWKLLEPGSHWVSFNTQEMVEETLGEIMWCQVTQSCLIGFTSFLGWHLSSGSWRKKVYQGD